MTSPAPHTVLPQTRRLWLSDRHTLIDFFEGLDANSRRMRFGALVGDRSVRDYAAHLLSIDSIVFGSFPDGTLRGVGELHRLLGDWPLAAEVAFAVQEEWQHEGIGEALFGRIVTAAQNRGIRSLQMLCMRDNERMQSLARRHEAVLEYETGDVKATLDTPWPTPLSLTNEIVGDTSTFLRAVFHLPQPPRRASQPSEGTVA